MDWIDIQQSFPGLPVRSGLGDVSGIKRKGNHQAGIGSNQRRHRPILEENSS